MSDRIQCFMLERTRFEKRYLRRYASGSTCPTNGYHDAMTFIDVAESVRDANGYRLDSVSERAYVGDSRWPQRCSCGYEFLPTDIRQVFTRALYKRVDDSSFHTLVEVPPGAMWYADWLEDGTPEYGVLPEHGNPLHYWRGPDNHVLIVKTPGGEWNVDSRASNCGLPNDNAHRCWVRHGVPPNVTVDKDGLTCSAGVGSIQCGDYHGFLRNGFLERC